MHIHCGKRVLANGVSRVHVVSILRDYKAAVMVWPNSFILVINTWVFFGIASLIFPLLSTSGYSPYRKAGALAVRISWPNKVYALQRICRIDIWSSGASMLSKDWHWRKPEKTNVDSQSYASSALAINSSHPTRSFGCVLSHFSIILTARLDNLTLLSDGLTDMIVSTRHFWESPILHFFFFFFYLDAKMVSISAWFESFRVKF